MAKCLLVIDMQNDFLNPKGYYAQKRNISPMIKIKDNLQTFLDKYFGKIPIVFIQAEYAPEQFGSNKFLCIKDSWGQEIVFDTQYANKIIKKNIHSSFSNPELNEFLKNNNIDTILISGVTTENCVRETSLEGIDKGYKIIIIKDCVGTNKELEENQDEIFNQLRNKGAKIIFSKDLNL
jgi:nicotinamidase-related amidase